jgi:hypothetical protein
MASGTATPQGKPGWPLPPTRAATTAKDTLITELQKMLAEARRPWWRQWK